MNITLEIEPVEEAYTSSAPLALKRPVTLKINGMDKPSAFN